MLMLWLFLPWWPSDWFIFFSIINWGFGVEDPVLETIAVCQWCQNNSKKQNEQVLNPLIFCSIFFHFGDWHQFLVTISTSKSPSLYGLVSVTDISFKSFVYLLHLIDSYHTIFTVGNYRRIKSLSILPQYADFISTLSVNLTVEDLGLLETLLKNDPTTLFRLLGLMTKNEK